MRFSAKLALLGVLVGASASVPLQAESYEEYLDRLRYVCEVECMEPRDLLRAARGERGRGASELAGILDIVHVSREGDRYRLHTEVPNENFEDLRTLDFGMRENRSRPVTSTSDIIVEMDQQTFIALFRPLSSSAGSSGELQLDADGEIVVQGQLGEEMERPTMRDLRRLIADRRIAVRGRVQLNVQFTGARRDYRRRQLTLELQSVDDLVLLPSYDEEGNPVLDGTVPTPR